MNDAVFNRNAFLEDKYNCSFEQIISNSMYPTSAEVQMCVTSGDDLIDLVLEGGGHIAENLKYFQNPNDLPYLDFDMPWWNKEFNEGITVAGKLFFTIGAYMISAREGLYHVETRNNLATKYAATAKSIQRQMESTVKKLQDTD